MPREPHQQAAFPVNSVVVEWRRTSLADVSMGGNATYTAFPRSSLDCSHIAAWQFHSLQSRSSVQLGATIRLGPYEIVSPLGAGGMGEVWKARDTRVDRIVAIKSSQEQFSMRFEREAWAIAALNHPNICSLFDIGPDYLVMECIDGVPIKPFQNTRKLLDLAVQIADGLSAAHAACIIHRDLKPANVLVTREGRVKILDFGLANTPVRLSPMKMRRKRPVGRTRERCCVPSRI